MKRTIQAILLSALLAACAGKATPLPDEGSKDAALYREKCGTCHPVAHPKRHDAAQWKHLLSVMEARMEHKKMEPLTENEKAAITGYLERNSR